MNLIKSTEFTFNTSDVVSEAENNTTILIKEVPITNENWKFFVFLIALSTVFLLAAVTIYLLLWRKQNIHGWTQFSYLLSFLLFNIVFIPALSPGIVSGSEINVGCYILAVTNQLFFISSKTWLLIIAFDILKNLWKYDLSINGKHYKTLILYSIFGWIFPIFFVGLGVYLNLSNQKALRSKLYENGLWTLIPDYGHLHCRIPNWKIWEIFVFSNCICHFIMFGLIIFVILHHRYTTKVAIESNSRSNTNQSLVVFIKLFFVVGLSWSYIALQDLLKAGNINTQQGWGWHLFRIIFFLQGVFISILYTCNEKTLRSLEEKYPAFKNFSTICQQKLKKLISCTELRRESLSTLSSSLHISRKSKVWTISNSDHDHVDNKV